MPALHIRKVDDAVVGALKQRARENGRSLEAELRLILRKAAFEEEREDDRPRRKLRLTTVSVASDATYGRDEIYGDDGR